MNRTDHDLIELQINTLFHSDAASRLCSIHPTPYPDVNAVLSALLAGVQAVLDHHLVGMYLDGSLVNGDFDQSSDIDFVVVTDEEISDEIFLALRALHDRVATGASPWVIQLEGS